MRVLVTTNPFGKIDLKPKEMLKKFGEVDYNNLGRKYSQKEIQEKLKKYDPEIIIAGTEEYDKETLNLCKSLKIISRVGIGVDNLDLKECKKRKIAIANTPDEPSNGVAELTIGHMINLLIKIPDMNEDLKKGIWNRYIGKDLSECVV